MRIAVVIVNWNAREDLLACLASLEAQTDREFHTVVVDNGSEDGSLQMIAARFAWVEVVDTGQNLGFAEGTNRGILAAHADWIATLNNDTVADPRWIEVLRSTAQAGDDRLGMIQSRLVFMQHPDRTNSTGVLLYTTGWAEDRDFDVPLRSDDRPEPVFCTTAGAGLYRSSMLEEIGLRTGVFDRTFFMYYEDVDLGWRARLAGWSAIYAPDAIVAHKFQASSRRRENRFIGLHIRRNRIRMLLKNGSWSFILRTLPRTLYNLCEAILWKGPMVLPQFVRAVADGLQGRREFASLVRVNRRDVEDAWVVDQRTKRSALSK